MDIAFDQAIAYPELQQFLQTRFSPDLLLLYPGYTTWDDLDGQSVTVQYLVNDHLTGGFKFGLQLFVLHEHLNALLENLAHQLATHFQCAALCDASRIVRKEGAHTYSLLFRTGKIWLVDDFDLEETGQVTRIVELAYRVPAVEYPS